MKSALFGLLGAFMLMAACATSGDVPATVSDMIYPAGSVTFRYFGQADQAVLAGDFTGWAPDDPRWRMRWNGEYFELTVELPPGRYQYRFVIDGSWNDPREAFATSEPVPSGIVPDGIGSWNAVLILQ